MKAILNKIGAKKTQPIFGQILQDGLNRVTLNINKPDGTSTIKSFTKDKYAIRYY